jgi:hypothetical protein
MAAKLTQGQALHCVHVMSTVEDNSDYIIVFLC